jgi:hypothetical protein
MTINPRASKDFGHRFGRLLKIYAKISVSLISVGLNIYCEQLNLVQEAM